MTQKTGKPSFYKYMLEEGMIDEAEFYFMVWYVKKVKEQLDKEVQ